MSRLALILCLPAALGLVRAQEKIANYKVVANVPGAEFYVDGQRYVSGASFFWTEGSSHVLYVNANSQGNYSATRYTFTGWSATSGSLTTDSTLVITARPDVTTYTATFTLEYLVTYRLNAPPGGARGTCAGMPADSTTGLCPTGDGSTWVPAGTTVTFLPQDTNPGWFFRGWMLNTGTPVTTFSATVNSPMHIMAFWQPARRVIVASNPPGLTVIVNRALSPSSDPSGACQYTDRLCPGQFDIAVGGNVLLAAPEVQRDGNNLQWSLDSFVMGGTTLGGQNSLYTVDSLGPNVSIVANFVRSVGATFYTQPGGLKLSINGRDNWLAYSFWWGLGSKNVVSAPAQQTDSRGRRYIFKSWTNGGDATQTVVPTQADLDKGGLRMDAIYDLMGRVTITGVVPGVSFLVNGASCKSPCVVDRAAGTEVQVAAPPSWPSGSGSRADFAGWADGGNAQRTIKLTTDAVNLTANYTRMYQLEAGSDPANGVTFHTDPVSTDGYYPVGTSVQVTAEAKPGFRFRRWAGDLTGTYPTGAVSLSRPAAILAMLDRVPYVAPAGIQNAAGDTPDDVVAPGSIISIYGESLASDVVVGPGSPLSQTLGGLVVRLKDRILPLFFVSPQQINALLPSDLAEGPYTLTVVTAAKQEVTGDFTVARNAPGVFTRPVVDGKPIVMASRSDKLPVTPDTKARAGEIITIYGTGFGPYDHPALDGFAIPDYPDYKAVDLVEIVAANQVYAPEWSGAAPGWAGMASVRFRVPETLPPGSVLEFAVRVGGRLSNTVLLPIE